LFVITGRSLHIGTFDSIVINRIHTTRKNLHKRKGMLPKDPNSEAKLNDIMWARADALLQEAERFRAVVMDLGYAAPAIPDVFYVRF
jgi:hypothetical protein